MSQVTFRLSDLVDEVAPRARASLGSTEAETFLRRLARYLPDGVGPLQDLYGEAHDVASLVRRLVNVTLDRAASRPDSLRALDARREADPGWFLESSTIGYVCYVDRFAGTLDGLRSRLDYLASLGVTYLHLMPVLAARAGENDGGYAVQDFEAVEPRLGTQADLTALADDLHARGAALCIDLVLNHTAREHDWAQRALAGDPAYREFFLVFPDRTGPDAYEATLPEIFPEMAPGSFTFVPELDGWVWTTFREFQWDLNYANPAVLEAMLGTMLGLANRGVDILRLDAAPFLWKRLGTTCMDLPEAHLVMQALRAFTRIAAPGLLLKAEAMLAPDLLGKYLGDHDPYRPECDLAYDNQVMVLLWSSMATQDGRLAAQALSRRRPAPKPTTWGTYVRCHDDIGWAVADADAEAIGLDGPSHRRYLSDFYAGDVAGSFARGVRFQANALGEAPISGMASALCGIEQALAEGDEAMLELAERRLETMYSVVFSVGGVPLVYMGDEVALPNDGHWEDDPAHAGDNRWMHRPPMDWGRVEAAEGGTGVAGRTLARLRRLAAERARLPALRSDTGIAILPTANPHVLAYRRGGRGEGLVALVNFSASPQVLGATELEPMGLAGSVLLHGTEGAEAPGGAAFGVAFGTASGADLTVPACGFIWLGVDDGTAVAR